MSDLAHGRGRPAKRGTTICRLFDDIHSLDTPALRAYIPFARAVANLRRIPFDESEEEYEILFRELGSRPDIHSIYREAIRVGFENRELLLVN